MKSGLRAEKGHEIQEWKASLAMIRCVAEVAGRVHDYGKAGSYFVEKLFHAANGQQVTPDPARHEWISMKMLERVLEGEAPQDALSRITAAMLREKPPLSQGVKCLDGVLLYVCGTHHRLFGPIMMPRRTSLAKLDASRHVQDELPPFTYPVAADMKISKGVDDALLHNIEFLRQAASSTDRYEPFWYAVAWWARVALILADHGVSARLVGGESHAGERVPIPPREPGLYANLWPDGPGKFGRGYNQPLEYHLAAVAKKAGDIAHDMWHMPLPGLDAQQVSTVLQPVQSRHARHFAWQDSVVDAIDAYRQSSDAPLLMFNVASTGAGKTVMNIKAGCAAAIATPRLSYALNLRSLTLQTGDALDRDLSLGSSSVATVIGDRVTAHLHEAGSTAADPQPPRSSESGEEYPPLQFEVSGGVKGLPAWLAPITDKRPEWRRILASPVLVSTADFLVQAGEPGRQGHHAAACLRLMHSDLILDEIDSYDGESLVAVLRLVQVAASLGRNVLCSSATLPWPIANAIAEAYQTGHEIWSALRGQPAHHETLMVSDVLPPTWIGKDRVFAEEYRHFIWSQNQLSSPVIRKVVLQDVDRSSGLSGLLSAIDDAAECLHQAQQWPFSNKEKQVSFGLVRVANIKTANAVAAYLEEQPGTVVCLYHARDFVIQRYLKERALDHLLSRKKGNAHLEQDESVQQVLEKQKAVSIRFVVVATPVEEIGRDHDFDWAVIEPSGSHSIVQTAGRVNRHRRVPVAQPNVAILQFNARALRHEKVVFTRPGPEGADSLAPLCGARSAYPDMGLMLDWSRLDQLTAAMAFDDRHALVAGEVALQQKRLREPMKVLKREGQYAGIWMTSRFYQKYALRGSVNDNLEDWRVLPLAGGGRKWERLERKGRRFEYVEKRAVEPDMKQTHWLSWHIQDLWNACEMHGIALEDGMKIKVLGKTPGRYL